MTALAMTILGIIAQAPQFINGAESIVASFKNLIGAGLITATDDQKAALAAADAALTASISAADAAAAAQKAA